MSTTKAKAPKTTQTKATKETPKQEMTLVKFLTLWINKSKATGKKYLTGSTEAGLKVTGFFNTEKQNPKEPDVRIFVRDDEGNLSKEEYVSLWCNVTKNEKKYFSGRFEGEKLVGFINSKAKINGKIPYLNIYFSEQQQKLEAESPNYVEICDDEELPFN